MSHHELEEKIEAEEGTVVCWKQCLGDGDKGTCRIREESKVRNIKECDKCDKQNTDSSRMVSEKKKKVSLKVIKNKSGQRKKETLYVQCPNGTKDEFRRNRGWLGVITGFKSDVIVEQS